MDTVADITVTPLSSALGAEIGGIDLRDDLPQAVIDEIRRLWLEHIVLVFRGQEITQDQQLRFGARFGDLGARKRAGSKFAKTTVGTQQTEPHTLLVSNIKEDGNPIGAFGEGDMWFHIDSGYTERPYKFTILFGVELPSTGGDTLFSNGYKAYETLPDELKELLAGKKALHIHQYKRSEKVDISDDISDSPHWYHPVFITHPETGRKTLFVDRLMTAALEGFEPGDSARILEQLFEHVESPELVYAHKWQLGDVVMWDNRCTPHGRTWFPENERRLLRRCTIEGEPLSE
jgi:taurine dioxygenase